MRKIFTLKRTLYCSLVVLLLGSFLSSCVKDTYDLNKASFGWNPSIAVPLVYSSMSIQDIITPNNKSGNILIGTDSFCTLVYSGNLFSLNASDVISIPDQKYHASVVLTAAQLNAIGALGTFTQSANQTLNFSSGSLQIDSLLFKTGNFNITLTNTFKYSGQLMLTIPGAKKNGVVFSQTIPITKCTGAPAQTIMQIDMSDYAMNLDSGSQSNKVNVNFSITLNAPGGPNVTSDSLALDLNFTSIKFRKLFGYFGQLGGLSPNTDTINFAINSKTIGGTFTLANPKVTITILNSLGLPINIGLPKFDGFTPPSTTVSFLKGGYTIPPILSPSIAQLGQYASTSFSLDNTNSNLAGALNSHPQEIIYKFSSLTNPLGRAGENFVLDTSKFIANIQVECPLYGTAKDFTLQDTMAFSSLSSLPTKNIESVLFRTYFSNGLPIDLGIQVYFTDSLYHKLDSLIVPYQVIMPSAKVDVASGKVTSATEKTTDIAINKTRLANLTKTKNLIIKATASTTNAGGTSVKIYSIPICIGTSFKLF